MKKIPLYTVLLVVVAVALFSLAALCLAGVKISPVLAASNYASFAVTLLAEAARKHRSDVEKQLEERAGRYRAENS